MASKQDKEHRIKGTIVRNGGTFQSRYLVPGARKSAVHQPRLSDPNA